MSLWNGLKSALGFTPGDDDDEDQYDASVPTYAVDHSNDPVEPDDEESSIRPVKKAKPEMQPASEKAEPQPKSSDDSLPGDIFDAVIQLFNSTMPEFVTTSLSLESQRKYIYDHINKSVRRRLENLGCATPAETSQSEVVERLLAEKKKLEDTLREMESSGEDAQRLREELKKVQSNADRQKRALTDRITDLDNQLKAQRAEKERIVTSRRGESAKEEVEKLKAELQAAKAETERQKTLKEQLETKTSMSDTMINDLRNEVARLREDLTQANENLEIAAQIQDKIAEFEQLKERKDAKINELKAKVKSLTADLEKISSEANGGGEELDKLRSENASLRQTIETNLYNQANSELKLRNELKELTAKLTEANEKLAAATAQPALMDAPTVDEPKRKRGRPRKQQRPLEDGLDNTDWLDLPDSDFGYHEPPRKHVPDNDAQLSLF
ncbi:MAG: hypothetical protein NC098_03655 [Lachnoclostridium sp.]|nr:hypothetical protein [Lachnoclostridium sp.]